MPAPAPSPQAAAPVPAPAPPALDEVVYVDTSDSDVVVALSDATDSDDDAGDDAGLGGSAEDVVAVQTVDRDAQAESGSSALPVSSQLALKSALQTAGHLTYAEHWPAPFVAGGDALACHVQVLGVACGGKSNAE